jgi:prepilin-type processing-associated H-X9-DG protein
MLLAILMPALGKVRQLAYRLMCGTNLKGLGTAMMVYSNDYDESYPVAGGKGGTKAWSNTIAGGGWSWAANETTSTITWASVTDVPVTASWFLLIKYADVSAAQFVCQASNQKKFEFDAANSEVKASNITDITGLWDFGKYVSATDNQFSKVSYVMQNPIQSYAASASGSAGKALAADRNPWVKDDGDFEKDNTAASSGTNPAGTPAQLLSPKGSATSGQSLWDLCSAENKKGATSQAHQAEGQNVLFNDGHVSFEKTVTCGIGQDNIYTYWSATTPDSTGTYNQVGKISDIAGSAATTRKSKNASAKSIAEDDSFLIL